MVARHVYRLVLAALICLLALMPRAGYPAPAAAAGITFTVNSTADAPDVHPGDGICADAAGQCTLRAAIQEADAQPGGTSITVKVPADTYGLTLGTLMLTANNITISGALSSTTVISGNNTGTVMAISRTVQANISQVTITGGNVGKDHGGGLVNQGLAVLSHSAINRNNAFTGGGIYNDVTGRLRLVASTVSDNTASFHNEVGGHGAGIYNLGTLSVADSTLSGNNTLLGFGGAIYNSGTVNVSSSTLSNNSVGSNDYLNSFGGGIDNAGGTVTLATSTVSNNIANSGGGIFNGIGDTLRVTGSTFTGNTAASGFGGGIDNGGGTVTLTDSTVDHNSAFAAIGCGGGGIENGTNSTLSMSGSTVSDNTTCNGLSTGGGIDNQGTASVSSSSITGNTVAFQGGGISNSGVLTVTGSTVSGNAMTTSGIGGGGLFNTGTATVISSTLNGNSSAHYGGGILNTGAATVSNNTLSGNTAVLGGGIWNGGTLNVSSSTLYSNTATQNPGGGGIANSCSGCITGTVALSYVTIASNSDGLDNFAGTVALTGTIVANSTPGRNCTGAITEGQGYNLDSGSSCGFSQSTDITNTNPLLGPLANNGGPTQTMALIAGSPAIDEGGTHANGCPASDQRGKSRPDERKDKGACDMGSYESQGVASVAN